MKDIADLLKQIEELERMETKMRKRLFIERMKREILRRRIDRIRR